MNPPERSALSAAAKAKLARHKLVCPTTGRVLRANMTLFTAQVERNKAWTNHHRNNKPGAFSLLIVPLSFRWHDGHWHLP